MPAINSNLRRRIDIPAEVIYAFDHLRRLPGGSNVVSRRVDTRSKNMRRIRCKDTVPELAVRSLVHRLGYRFRLHQHGLPGRPDMVFGARKRAVFVHGCFWHGHRGCRRAHQPKSNTAYWTPKLLSNRIRDATNRIGCGSGWQSLVIWECETSDERRLTKRIVEFLGPVRVEQV